VVTGGPDLALRRRGFLLGAAAAALPGGRGWLEALASRARGGLLLSYEKLSDTPFDRAHGNCAYVYDNAVAGIALLAGGRVAAARVLGDALVDAQKRDRFWQDGRLRNAYAAGPVAATGSYPLPGWWDAAARHWVEDAYQVGTSTGVVAWAMLFLLRLGAATGDARYRAAAARAGDWVEDHVHGARGYAGGFLGWEPSPDALTWVSTEHNLDLAVAFAALGRTDAARHARAFVESMWDADRFLAGLTPEGAENHAAAVDANIWPLLAPGAVPAWSPALDWVLAHQGVPAANPEGVDFNDDRDGMWLEGTAYVALLARRIGRPELAARMMRTLTDQTAPGGLVWATNVPRLTTGFSTGLTTEADFVYYRRPHIGATGWAALAALEASPFDT
jgi:hypothetical protein